LYKQLRPPLRSSTHSRGPDIYGETTKTTTLMINFTIASVVFVDVELAVYSKDINISNIGVEEDTKNCKLAKSGDIYIYIYIIIL